MNGLTGTVAGLYNAFEPDLKVMPTRAKHLQVDQQLLDKIASIDGVNYVSLSLSDKALIKNNEKQILVTVKGVDANFNKITKIDSALVEGIYALNDTTSPKIILGSGIASQIQVNLSSYVNELSLLSPIKGKSGSLNPDDNLNQIYFTPCGVFSLNDEFDYQYVFIPLKYAIRLFDAGNQISAIELGCEPNKQKDIQSQLNELLGKDYVVKNKYQLNDVLFKSLETEKLATFIILAFILIIATFNIIGALTMLIIEKKRDIKTLYSMGADITLIRSIFMREGFLITGVGALIGLVLGLLVCWAQIQFHLVKYSEDFVVPYYPVEMQWMDFVKIFGLIMLIGFFAALYPVRIFTRVDLVK